MMPMNEMTFDPSAGMPDYLNDEEQEKYREYSVQINDAQELLREQAALLGKYYLEKYRRDGKRETSLTMVYDLADETFRKLQTVEPARAELLAGALERRKAEEQAAQRKAAEAALIGMGPSEMVWPEVCPECGTPVSGNGKFCMECGRKLEPIRRPRPSVCPFCGSKVEPGNRFCMECGKPLTPPVQETAGGAEQKEDDALPELVLAAGSADDEPESAEKLPELVFGETITALSAEPDDVLNVPELTLEAGPVAEEAGQVIVPQEPENAPELTLEAGPVAEEAGQVVVPQEPLNVPELTMEEGLTVEDVGADVEPVDAEEQPETAVEAETVVETDGAVTAAGTDEPEQTPEPDVTDAPAETHEAADEPPVLPFSAETTVPVPEGLPTLTLEPDMTAVETLKEDKAQAPKKRFCRNCGAELEPDMKFCMECGAKVETR